MATEARPPGCSGLLGSTQHHGVLTPRSQARPPLRRERKAANICRWGEGTPTMNDNRNRNFSTEPVRMINWGRRRTKECLPSVWEPESEISQKHAQAKRGQDDPTEAERAGSGRAVAHRV